MDEASLKSWDQLSGAIYKVGLLADRTWWNDEDSSDVYKQASLRLWNEVVYANERLNFFCHEPAKNFTDGDVANVRAKPFNGSSTMLQKNMQLLACTSGSQMGKTLASMDPSVPAALPQSAYATRSVLCANWPRSLLSTYPVLSHTLGNTSFKSVFSPTHAAKGAHRKLGPVFPVNITAEEALYQRITSPAVRNIWESDNERIKSSKGPIQRHLNVNIPEFYPSVLLPPRQCPPRYSNVYGANYQSEVFPYNEDQASENEAVNVAMGRKSRRGTSEQRLPSQLQVGVSSSSSPNLLHSRSVSDDVICTVKENEAKPDLERWLQRVYPNRIAELSKMGAIVRHFELVFQQINQPSEMDQRPPVVPPPRVVNERRLYRDVVARQIKDAVDAGKEESNTFDELERQALEQYQSSETCLVAQNDDVPADPEDSKFQDLEREALEQYEDGGDMMTVDGTPTLSKATDATLAKIPSNLKVLPSGTARYPSYDFRPTYKSKKQSNQRKKSTDSEGRRKLRIGKNQENSKSIFKQLNGNAEDEIRKMAKDLKYKVLNYLKGVDLRIAEDKKTNQKNKESTEAPIQRRVRVSDIAELETYKLYIKEVSARARGALLLNFRRIRSEIMDSTSRGVVSFVGPTTAEKRGVRKIIKKCLELKTHADSMNNVPKNLLNVAKREATDTLELVHHAMKVIYTLSKMSKQASEGIEYLRKGRRLTVELFLEEVTLEDISPYVKQRALVEDRSVLLVVLFPRRHGLLLDRIYELLCAHSSWSVYVNHDDLRLGYDLLLRNVSTPSIFGTNNAMEFVGSTPARINNFWVFDSKTYSQDVWNPRNWTHVLQVGKAATLGRVTFDSTCRQAERFGCYALTMVDRIECGKPSWVETLVGGAFTGRRLD